MSEVKNNLSYASAGVNIDAGNVLVDKIKPHAQRTNRTGVIGGLGGFGGLFDLKDAGFKDPILVAATDGVGTKLKISIDTEQFKSVGIDLVAMCVNDLVCQGAEPLFFLDYFATGKLDVDIAAKVVEGISEGCLKAGCALIGGETAEMPDMYSKGDFDIAGFAVGAKERGQAFPKGVSCGDTLLGLSSSGIHSNGYSLVRKVVKFSGLEWSDPCPFSQESLGTAVMTPTRLYVKSCLAALDFGGVNGLAHITGGGLIENIPRTLNQGQGVTISLDAWELPEVFKWLAYQGEISQIEMLKTFNCGIGMVVVVQSDRIKEITAVLEEAGEKVYPIGTVTDEVGVEFKGSFL